MVPAGYLLKRVSPPPGWLKDGLTHVRAVCSVADCVNDNLVDVQTVWQHNGFGVANDPSILQNLVSECQADVSSATLFFYEAYECELESDGWTFNPENWRPWTAAQSAGVRDEVLYPPPGVTGFLGYDVVVFCDYLEHSPLSCNSIAQTLSVNEHCLFNTFDEAKQAIDSGAFGGGCEEGIYKIYSVSTVNKLAQTSLVSEPSPQ
jgi:hypothetical protein